jgi:hypothetical protein
MEQPEYEIQGLSDGSVTIRVKHFNKDSVVTEYNALVAKMNKLYPKVLEGKNIVVTAKGLVTVSANTVDEFDANVKELRRLKYPLAVDSPQ